MNMGMIYQSSSNEVKFHYKMYEDIMFLTLVLFQMK